MNRKSSGIGVMICFLPLPPLPASLLCVREAVFQVYIPKKTGLLLPPPPSPGLKFHFWSFISHPSQHHVVGRGLEKIGSPLFYLATAQRERTPLQLILIFLWKFKRTQTAKTILKRSMGVFTVGDFKTYHKPIIKIVWYWYMDRHIDQWDRIETTERNSRLQSLDFWQGC